MDDSQLLEPTQALPDDWGDEKEEDSQAVIGWLEVGTERYKLVPGDNMIGRDPATCSVVLASAKGVSKQHAMVTVEGAGVTLTDLGSTNKTRLARLVLRPHVMYALSGGETIRFGNVAATYIVNTAQLAEDDSDNSSDRISTTSTASGPLLLAPISPNDPINMLNSPEDTSQYYSSHEIDNTNTGSALVEPKNVELKSNISVKSALQDLVRKNESTVDVNISANNTYDSATDDSCFIPCTIEETQYKKGPLKLSSKESPNNSFSRKNLFSRPKTVTVSESDDDEEDGAVDNDFDDSIISPTPRQSGSSSLFQHSSVASSTNFATPVKTSSDVTGKTIVISTTCVPETPCGPIASDGGAGRTSNLKKLRQHGSLGTPPQSQSTPLPPGHTMLTSSRPLRSQAAADAANKSTNISFESSSSEGSRIKFSKDLQHSETSKDVTETNIEDYNSDVSTDTEDQIEHNDASKVLDATKDSLKDSSEISSTSKVGSMLTSATFPGSDQSSSSSCDVTMCTQELLQAFMDNSCNESTSSSAVGNETQEILAAFETPTQKLTVVDSTEGKVDDHVFKKPFMTPGRATKIGTPQKNVQFDSNALSKKSEDIYEVATQVMGDKSFNNWFDAPTQIFGEDGSDLPDAATQILRGRSESEVVSVASTQSNVEDLQSIGDLPTQVFKIGEESPKLQLHESISDLVTQPFTDESEVVSVASTQPDVEDLQSISDLPTQVFKIGEESPKLQLDESISDLVTQPFTDDLHCQKPNVNKVGKSKAGATSSRFRKTFSLHYEAVVPKSFAHTDLVENISDLETQPFTGDIHSPKHIFNESVSDMATQPFMDDIVSPKYPNKSPIATNTPLKILTTSPAYSVGSITPQRTPTHVLCESPSDLPTQPYRGDLDMEETSHHESDATLLLELQTSNNVSIDDSQKINDGVNTNERLQATNTDSMEATQVFNLDKMSDIGSTVSKRIQIDQVEEQKAKDVFEDTEDYLAEYDAATQDASDEETDNCRAITPDFNGRQEDVDHDIKGTSENNKKVADMNSATETGVVADDMNEDEDTDPPTPDLNPETDTNEPTDFNQDVDIDPPTPDLNPEADTNESTDFNQDVDIDPPTPDLNPETDANKPTDFNEDEDIDPPTPDLNPEADTNEPADFNQDVDIDPPTPDLNPETDVAETVDVNQDVEINPPTPDMNPDSNKTEATDDVNQGINTDPPTPDTNENADADRVTPDLSSNNDELSQTLNLNSESPQSKKHTTRKSTEIECDPFVKSNLKSPSPDSNLTPSLNPVIGGQVAVDTLEEFGEMSLPQIDFNEDEEDVDSSAASDSLLMDQQEVLQEQCEEEGEQVPEEEQNEVAETKEKDCRKNEINGETEGKKDNLDKLDCALSSRHIRRDAEEREDIHMSRDTICDAGKRSKSTQELNEYNFDVSTDIDENEIYDSKLTNRNSKSVVNSSEKKSLKDKWVSPLKRTELNKVSLGAEITGEASEKLVKVDKFGDVICAIKGGSILNESSKVKLKGLKKHEEEMSGSRESSYLPKTHDNDKNEPVFLERNAKSKAMIDSEGVVLPLRLGYSQSDFISDSEDFGDVSCSSINFVSDDEYLGNKSESVNFQSPKKEVTNALHFKSPTVTGTLQKTQQSQQKSHTKSLQTPRRSVRRALVKTCADKDYDRPSAVPAVPAVLNSSDDEETMSASQSQLLFSMSMSTNTTSESVFDVVGEHRKSVDKFTYGHVPTRSNSMPKNEMKSSKLVAEQQTKLSKERKSSRRMFASVGSLGSQEDSGVYSRIILKKGDSAGPASMEGNTNFDTHSPNQETLSQDSSVFCGFVDTPNKTKRRENLATLNVVIDVESNCKPKNIHTENDDETSITSCSIVKMVEIIELPTRSSKRVAATKSSEKYEVKTVTQTLKGLVKAIDTSKTGVSTAPSTSTDNVVSNRDDGEATKENTSSSNDSHVLSTGSGRGRTTRLSQNLNYSSKVTDDVSSSSTAITTGKTNINTLTDSTCRTTNETTVTNTNNTSTTFSRSTRFKRRPVRFSSNESSYTPSSSEGIADCVSSNLLEDSPSVSPCVEVEITKRKRGRPPTKTRNKTKVVMLEDDHKIKRMKKCYSNLGESSKSVSVIENSTKDENEISEQDKSIIVLESSKELQDKSIIVLESSKELDIVDVEPDIATAKNVSKKSVVSSRKSIASSTPSKTVSNAQKSKTRRSLATLAVDLEDEESGSKTVQSNASNTRGRGRSKTSGTSRARGMSRGKNSLAGLKSVDEVDELLNMETASDAIAVTESSTDVGERSNSPKIATSKRSLRYKTKFDVELENIEEKETAHTSLRSRGKKRSIEDTEGYKESQESVPSTNNYGRKELHSSNSVVTELTIENEQSSHDTKPLQYLHSVEATEILKTNTLLAGTRPRRGRSSTSQELTEPKINQKLLVSTMKTKIVKATATRSRPSTVAGPTTETSVKCFLQPSLMEASAASTSSQCSSESLSSASLDTSVASLESFTSTVGRCGQKSLAGAPSTPKTTRFSMMGSPGRFADVCSPSGRTARLNGKQRVLFTGYEPSSHETSIITRLGGRVVAGAIGCSVLVAVNAKRTCKFLACVARGVPIVTPAWVSASASANCFVDPRHFPVKDAQMERKFNFDLQRTQRLAGAAAPSGGGDHRVFTGFSIHATPSVRPDPDQMKELVECGGGHYLACPPTGFYPNVVVVSCVEDKRGWPGLRRLRIPVLSTEFILTGILRYHADVEANIIK